MREPSPAYNPRESVLMLVPAFSEELHERLTCVEIEAIVRLIVWAEAPLEALYILAAHAANRDTECRHHAPGSLQSSAEETLRRPLTEEELALLNRMLAR